MSKSESQFFGIVPEKNLESTHRHAVFECVVWLGVIRLKFVELSYYEVWEKSLLMEIMWLFIWSDQFVDCQIFFLRYCFITWRSFKWIYANFTTKQYCEQFWSFYIGLKIFQFSQIFEHKIRNDTVIFNDNSRRWSFLHANPNLPHRVYFWIQ